MNKKVSFIAVFILLAGMLFTACEKDQVAEDTQNQVEDPVLERILDFKADVENPLKSGGEDYISVEDAVWIVEAALNYSYCMITEEQAEAEANKQITDSLFFDINVESGQVLYQDAISAYLNFETKMQNIINALDYEVKFFTIANVEFENGNLKTTVLIRYKEPETKFINYCDITDDWYWGLFGTREGKCDGTCEGRDARSEISKWIGCRTAIIAGVYYTDIHFVNTFSSCNTTAVDLSSYGVDMFVYYENSPVPDELKSTWICLEQSECIHYAQECQQAFSVIENNFINSDEDITRSILAGDAFDVYSGINIVGCHFSHHYYIEAGTRHYGGGGSHH